jgi:hypothetical protein
MSDRTGIARGSLSPVIYFERASDNYIIVPGYDAGKPEQARKVYEEKYRNGWRWCETGSDLASVDRLQKRLVEQEMRRTEQMAETDYNSRERAFKMSGEVLRQRMVSADTTPYERDFIAAYLKLREDKRSKYQQRLTEHNFYLWSREQDASTKIEDKLPLLEGQFERKDV